MTVRVLVADDQPLVRAGLGGIIATADDLELVATAADGAEAVEGVREHAPDVVLMDIRMPGMNGIDATAAITTSSDAQVVILTTFDLEEYVYAALRAGAAGFLLKDSRPADLISAVRVVAAGEALLAPSVTRRLITRFASAPDAAPAAMDPRVTAREREVLMLVADGLSNAEIAATLHITPGTVKTHVAHLLTKLDARDRVHLVIIAFRCGLARGAQPRHGGAGTAGTGPGGHRP